MIYFDNAATTLQKPEIVYSAMAEAARTCAGIGRSGHGAAMRAAEIAFNCRAAAGELFDIFPEQVVFTTNATHALNIAIRTLVKKNDRVVISGFEHNAVVRPLHAIGADVISAGHQLFNQEETLQAFRSAITSDTKAVICTHVSNVFGYRFPIEEIAEICIEKAVPLIVDAAQSAGILPISMKKLNAAFIAMPGHKGLYGPQGTGLLLCGKIPDPLIFGGTGSISMDPDMPEFLPDRAEAGTHNLPGIAGLLEGIQYIKKRGTHNISQYENGLRDLLLKEISDLGNLKIYTGYPQTGVLSLEVIGMDSENVATALWERGIAVRAGLHCSPLAHLSAGTIDRGTVRISFSNFNTDEEVYQLADTLHLISKQK